MLNQIVKELTIEIKIDLFYHIILDFLNGVDDSLIVLETINNIILCIYMKIVSRNS